MSERLNRYFVSEALEYLDQLDRLLAAPEPPAPDHLLRLIRGVRGSARMAGAEAVARVAQRVEDAVRSAPSAEALGSPGVREQALGTISDLRLLLDAAHRWDPEEERHAHATAQLGDGEGDSDAAPADPIVPIEALFHDDAGPHLLSTPPASAVPIEALLLQGDGALQAALDLRPRVEALARDASPALREALDELFDLIRQARGVSTRVPGV